MPVVLIGRLAADLSARGEKAPPADAAGKLLAMQAIAQEWKKRSEFPLRREPRSDVDQPGRTLLDLLIADPLDMPAILGTWTNVVAAGEIADLPWPESMHEIAKRLGTIPDDMRQSDHIIDTVTGRPMY